MDYKIFWTEEAINNLEDIINYLQSRWSPREVDNFKAKMSKQVDLICKNPGLFPVSSFQPRLRKAVLSKQTTIFYEVKNREIYLTYIFVNYKSPDEIK